MFLVNCGEPISFGIFSVTPPSVEQILYKLGVLIYDALYGLIIFIYNLFYAVATANVFKEDAFNLFAEKIFSVLGVVMLFIVTFALFKLLFEPNKLETQGSKLAVNILSTIAILVSVSFIFQQLRNLQQLIISENIIGKIIIPSDTATPDLAANEAGREMAVTILENFYTQKVDTQLNQVSVHTIRFYGENDTVSTLTWNQVFEEVKTNGPAFLANLHCEDLKANVTFYWVFAAAAAIFVCWVFGVYAFAVGLRVIKLAFYQIIAPIPIASRIIPNDKNNTFQKWVKAVTATYLDVFIRIGFVMLLLSLIALVKTMNLTEMWEGLDNVNAMPMIIKTFAKMIVVVGLFRFLHVMPKIMSDVFGIGGDDLGFGLKNLKESFSGVTSAASKLKSGYSKTKQGVAGVRGFTNNFRNAFNRNRANGRGALSSLGRGVSSGRAGARNAAANAGAGTRIAQSLAVGRAAADGVNAAKESRDKAINALATQRATEHGRSAPTLGDIMRTRAALAFGSQAKKEKLQSQLKAFEEGKTNSQELTSTANSAPGVREALIASSNATAQANAIDAAAAAAKANESKNADDVDAAKKNRDQAKDELDATKKALSDNSFNADTKSIDANGNVINNKQKFNDAEEAKKYADEQRKMSDTAKQKLSAKEIEEKENAAKIAKQKALVTDAQNKVNNATDPTDRARAQGELAAAQGELTKLTNNQEKIRQDKEALTKQSAIHESNARNVEAGAKVVSDRKAILTASSSQVPVSFRQTTVDSAGSFSEQKQITGIAAAESYINDENQRYQDTRSAMSQTASELTDLRNQREASLLASPSAENLAKIAELDNQISAKETTYNSQAQMSEVHLQNASSAREALSQVLQTRSVADTSQTKIQYETRAMDSNGNIVASRATAIGAEQAQKVIAAETAKVQALSTDKQVAQQDYSAAISKKQEATKNIDELRSQIAATDLAISAAEAKGDTNLADDGRATRSGLVSQLNSQLNVQSDANSQVALAQEKISSISDQMDLHQANIQSVSSSVIDTYKVSGIGATSAPITYTSYSKAADGTIVAKQETVIGASKANEVIINESAQINKLTQERDTNSNRLVTLQSSQATSEAKAQTLNTEIININQQIETLQNQRQQLDSNSPTYADDQKVIMTQITQLAEQAAPKEYELSLVNSGIASTRQDIQSTEAQIANIDLEIDVRQDGVQKLSSELKAVVNNPNLSGDIGSLEKRVVDTEATLSAATAKQNEDIKIVQTYDQAIKEKTEADTRVDLAYEQFEVNNSSYVTSMITKLNKNITDIAKTSPEKLQELKDKYGIDGSKPITFKEAMAKKDHVVKDSNGNDRVMKVSLLDWFNNNATSINKDIKNYENAEKPDMPKKAEKKASPKPDKKEGGGK